MCIYIYIYIIETHTQYHTHFFIWGLSFGHRCKHCEEEDWELHRKKTGGVVSATELQETDADHAKYG